ncbi:hypothetical protein BX666DRAFT_1853771 [Dichotomocladium elegans]|nr:hypothetical protein BX666DRAFT_1853771 [Dichotomocladium elegans]
MEISPLQLHYFKREMLAIQLNAELDQLQQRPELLALLQSSEFPGNVDLAQLPFLHYMFQQTVAEFPLLKTSRRDKFWAKVHEFLQEAGKVQINTIVPRETDASQRKVMIRKLQRTLLLALNVGIKTVQGQEESIKVTPDDLAKLQSMLASPTSPPSRTEQGGPEASKAAQQQHREHRALLLGAVTHAEFIICTTIESDESIHTLYVARRHRHFRQLSEKLKSEYPGARVPMAPAKFIQNASGPGNDSKLLRERDRMLLNAYLRRIIGKSKFNNSSGLREFLTADPIQLLDHEVADAAMRSRLDDQRVEQSIRIRKEVDKTVVELNDLLEMLKQQVMQPGGLISMMNMIKKSEQIADLPESLRKAFEWGRINFAFALYRHFVTDDAAAENVGTLKRTHNFLPYRTIAMILRFSNPMAMVKGVIDLFLAQPLGSKSLFQRIMAANMLDDVHLLEKEIKALQEEINDEMLCTKIVNAVNTPAGSGREESSTSPVFEVVDLLRRDDIEPVLSVEQINVLSDIKTSKKKLKLLYGFWVLQTRRREQELMMTLAFQGITGEILKELFAIFYEPLAQVYKAANISDSIHDISAFMDDLIQLLDNLDVTIVEENTVEPFILLVQRHEHKFYRFVHRVHSQEVSDLFDKLIIYVDQILGSLTRGILPGRPLDLNEVLDSAGITPDMHSDLRQEIDSLCKFRHYQKAQHLARTRQKVIAHSKIAQDDIELEDHSSSTDEEDFSDSDVDNAEESEMSSLSSRDITPPTLKIIPTIAPHFVSKVSKMMDIALLENQNTLAEKPSAAS